MRRYKHHHNVLTFLKDKYFTNQNEDISAYSFSSEVLSKELNLNVSKLESVLFDLVDNDCVVYNEARGFIISQLGIKKQINQFYLFKDKDNFRNILKERLSIIVSLIAIFSFILTMLISSRKSDKENINKIDSLKIEIKKINENIDRLKK